MKTWRVGIIIIALGIAAPLWAADDAKPDHKAKDERQQIRSKDEDRSAKRAKADIESRVRAINALDSKPAAFQAGLREVSKETAVPVPTLQSEHRDHPKLGLGGLFMAHELAVHTKKPVDNIIKRRMNGAPWQQIARENNQDLSVIEAKLERIEQAMRDATK